MARTIDNLGVDTSTQYAENREAFDESLIRDARGIQQQTKIDVTTPFLTSQFDTLFDLEKRGTTWSCITHPPQYHISNKPLFAEKILPGLGSPESQERRIERLEAHRLDERPDERPDEERKAILTLLRKIDILNTELLEINAKRVQYQKG